MEKLQGMLYFANQSTVLLHTHIPRSVQATYYGSSCPESLAIGRPLETGKGQAISGGINPIKMGKQVEMMMYPNPPVDKSDQLY